MASRTLNVQITGDSRDMERATRRASGELDKLAKQTSVTARVTSKGFSGMSLAAHGLAAGIGGVTLGAGFLVKQFEESNKVAKQTAAVLKSTGGAAHVTAKQVSDLATQISRKTGIDDEAIQSGENLLLTFTNIHNEAGRGNKIFSRATQTLTDMSVALGQDTKTSAIQLGKALNDPVRGITALQRVGVSFTQGQRDQIKALVDSGHAMQAQKVILRELNKEFGGSAAAQATPFDKLKVSAGNLAETLGGYLAPTLGKAAGWLNKFLNQMQDGTGAGGKFAAAVSTAVSVVKTTVGRIPGYWRDMTAAVRGFIHRNEDTIDALRQAVQNVATAVRWWINHVIIPVVKDLVPAFEGMVSGALEILGGLVKFVANVFSGRWGKAWDGVKDIVKGAFKLIGSEIKGFVSVALTLAKAIGGTIGKGILAGLGNLGHLILGKVKDALGFVAHALTNPAGTLGGLVQSIGKKAGIGDGVGVAIRNAMPPMPPPGSGGALMGAHSNLAPFANLAAGIGLHTSSGFRPGARTLNGAISYHALGDAIDEAGPTGAMFRYASTLYHTAGSRLRELISPWPQFNIKDGRPYNYPPNIEAQHSGSNAHVHVAYTGDGIGRRGDGLGEFTATAYGPPWGGIQGGGVTATGVNLKNAPHMYGIAVDPRVLKLGRNYFVWPNPFGYRGAFRAFDTGGAIKGNRIDFYDWRGRGAQNGWGRRSVMVSTSAAPSSGSHSSSSAGGGPALSGGGSVTGFGNTAAGIGSTLQGGTNEALIGPGQPGGYDQQLATAGVHEANARAHDNLKGLIKALQEELRIKVRRLRKIRKLLKGHIRKATRVALLQEEATLIGDIADLKSNLKEYSADEGGGATTITRADELTAGVDPNAGTGGTTGGDTGGGGMDTGPDVGQQLIDAVKALNATQAQLLAIAKTQGPQITAALLAMISGGIGGKVGLGVQTPGYSGGGVRY
jgi:3D (Asp-Asp-Asp) domain-containing protein